MSLFPWIRAISSQAAAVDVLTLAFTILLFALTLPVFIALVAFSIRYRAGRPADRSGGGKRGAGIELAWSTIPFALSLVFFVIAAAIFADQRTAPADAITIAAVGKQWMWKFQHAGGQREINELHVPAGERVKLELNSQDVIHSLYLPALRIKQDVLPGRTTMLWFKADTTGVYPLRCSEFCGTDHSLMGGTLVVMPPEEYRRWLDAGGGSALAQRGFELFRAHGCSGCHSPQSTRRAPPLEGVYGSVVALEGGTRLADDAYVRDSIVEPARDIVAGYQPIMPSFKGMLTDADLQALVAYVKSLADTKETSDGRRQ